MFDAHVVSMPAVLKLSFTAIGIPSKTPRGWPAWGIIAKATAIRGECALCTASSPTTVYFTRPFGRLLEARRPSRASDGCRLHFQEPSSILMLALSVLPTTDLAPQSGALQLGPSPQDRQVSCLTGVLTSSNGTTWCLFQPQVLPKSTPSPGWQPYILTTWHAQWIWSKKLLEQRKILP